MTSPHLSFAVTSDDFPYLYRWDRQNRKGQLCKVTARGKMNSICVEFEDGYSMVTSGNAIRRRQLLPEQETK